MLASLVLAVSLLPQSTDVGGGDAKAPPERHLAPEQWSGDPRFWSVEGGVLVGRSTPEVPCERSSFLVHEGRFDDFDLSLEYQVEGGNSGVQFRSKLEGPWDVVGYQADLEDGPNWTGGVYEQGGRGVLARRATSLMVNGGNSDYDLLADPADLADVGRGAGWHTYRIRAEGTLVRLWVDGVLTCELDDRTPGDLERDGRLALQMHPGPPMTVRYRNIRLRELTETPPPARKWIWVPGGPKDGQVVRLERRLKVGPGLTRAVLSATCDDGVEFALDGSVFAGGDDWARPFEVALPAALLATLKDGAPHLLTAECWNGGGPAGLSAELRLEYADGHVERVETDRWWRVGGTRTRAEVLGPHGMQPWGLPTGKSSGAPERMLGADALEVPAGFEAEALLRAPRARGSWVALTVDGQGRIIVAAEAEHGLSRLTERADGSFTVEPLDLGVGGAQGLAWVNGDLYIVKNDWTAEDNGLHRARDTDGDDRYDELTLLQHLDGSGEHGAHAVRPTPDGARLQVIAGNSVALPDPISRTHVPLAWFDDQVLPSMPDTFGHGNAMHLHGGWTATCDLDGGDWELISVGLRNAYDFAYDASGNAFTYDADMEWDMGAPWYRAPRVVRLAPGLEYGWRRGSGKIPASSPETFPPVCSTGPASPVGVLHGKDGGFPAPYDRQLFVADWTRGTVYAVDLELDRDRFAGEAVPFLRGRPFPITDMEWMPDGSMVLLTGGRGRRSGLYRIRSAIERRPTQARTTPARTAPAQTPPARTVPASYVRGPLAERQARVRLELDPDVERWGAEAVSSRDPQGLLALARAGGVAWQARSLEAVLAGEGPLSPVAVRTIGLSVARWGDPEPALVAALTARLEASLPAPAHHEDVAIVELLTRFGSPAVPAHAVPRMERAPSQEVAIDYAAALCLCDQGWTPELARRFLDLLHVEARAFRGGRSLQGYLDRMRAAALERVAPAVTGGYEAPAAPAERVPPVEAALFVEDWTLEELLPSLRFLDRAVDRGVGERSFRRAGCYACHRVGDEGGGTGPDLTDAGGRFTPSDLLVAILEPSRDVSDQYRDTEIWTRDDEVFVGRRAESEDGWVAVQLPPSAPGGVDGEVVEVPEDEVRLLRPSPTSRMPSGTLDGLTQAEILELVAWLLEAR